MTQPFAFSGSSSGSADTLPHSVMWGSKPPALPSCASLMTTLWQHLAGCEGCYTVFSQARLSGSAGQPSSQTATEATVTFSGSNSLPISILGSLSDQKRAQAILQSQVPSCPCQTGRTVGKSTSSKRVRRRTRRKRSGR